MKKATFKIILSLLHDKIEQIYYGYEMDCLISAEFTPAPDYSEISTYADQLLTKYGSSLIEFQAWLNKQAMAWKHPYSSSEYDSMSFCLHN
jgi:hypothetical protein